MVALRWETCVGHGPWWRGCRQMPPQSWLRKSAPDSPSVHFSCAFSVMPHLRDLWSGLPVTGAFVDFCSQGHWCTWAQSSAEPYLYLERRAGNPVGSTCHVQPFHACACGSVAFTGTCDCNNIPTSVCWRKFLQPVCVRVSHMHATILCVRED